MFWSTPLWNAIHVLSVQCNDDIENKTKVFNLIKTICGFIPCDKCRRHASRYFNSNKNYNNIKEYYFNFHNHVKQKKRLRINKNIQLLEKYKDMDREAIIVKALTVLRISKLLKQHILTLIKSISFNQLLKHPQ